MKNLLLVVLLILTLAACTQKTDLGPCIGMADDPDPALMYKADGMNVVWAVVFIETIYVPAYVILTDLRCPIARRE